MSHKMYLIIFGTEHCNHLQAILFYKKFDKRLTLEKLENVFWEGPTVDSYVVSSCHYLRKKPLGNFAGENMRIVISQDLSLDYMVPIAMDKLPQNAWEGGSMYDGCLLTTVLEIDLSFWKENIYLFYELKEVMIILVSQIETVKNRIDSLWM